jgi:hypothetical protein
MGDENIEYLFMIYSCKKNLERAEIIYERIHQKINKCKVYIIYGDKANVSDSSTSDKYLVLNVDDDYDHLNMKTLLLLQTAYAISEQNAYNTAEQKAYPNFKGIFKCDDDMWININFMNNFIKENSRHIVDYAGYVATYRHNDTSTHNVPANFECEYCGGPLYYLSKKSLACFQTTNLHEKAFMPIYYEDVMVGKHLHHNNISPVREFWSQLYSDNIALSHEISYHNSLHHQDLTIVLQGGIGNQLFQLACGMKMAQKYNKRFVLNVQGIITNQHQHHDLQRTITTLKRLCPALTIVDQKLNPEHYHLFKEGSNDCFLAPMEKLDHAFQTYSNVALHGYYIHSAYLPTLQDQVPFTDIPQHLKPSDLRLLNHNFENTYFLHIRLGDFLKHPMYQIELKSYYNYCIQQITRLNPLARFYICTNQYDAVLQNYVKDFHKWHHNTGNKIQSSQLQQIQGQIQRQIQYYVQDPANDEVDTLYIMSSCQGAICSNSTLSYMGAFFQTLKRQKAQASAQQASTQQQQSLKETIYMPYPYVRFLNGFNETNVTTSMYPEWCSIYNTLNNQLMTKKAE